MKSLELVLEELLTELNEKRSGVPGEGSNTTAMLGKGDTKPSKIYYLGGHPKKRRSN